MIVIRLGQTMYKPDDELKLINDKQYTRCLALEAKPIGRRDARILARQYEHKSM